VHICQQVFACTCEIKYRCIHTCVHILSIIYVSTLRTIGTWCCCSTRLQLLNRDTGDIHTYMYLPVRERGSRSFYMSFLAYCGGVTALIRAQLAEERDVPKHFGCMHVWCVSVRHTHYAPLHTLHFIHGQERRERHA